MRRLNPNSLSMGYLYNSDSAVDQRQGFESLESTEYTHAAKILEH
jgi:hypothetical protein